MAKNKGEHFFWVSYSDLMTSMFFIMLLLFVLSSAGLYFRSEATQKELDEIKSVQNSTKDLSREYFDYNEEYKKYILKVECFFPVLHTQIFDLSEGCRDSLKLAGKEIGYFLAKHREHKYVLIIEGQASKNSQAWTDRNYELSFQRAYSLMRYWQDDCKIDFGNNCEFQISGSGDGRYNIDAMRDDIEEKNQRFLIHIIPKNIIEDNAGDSLSDDNDFYDFL